MPPSPADRVYREWPEDSDPARVTLHLDLLPAEDVEPYLYTERRIAEYEEAQSTQATESGGMALRSLGSSEFGIAGIQRLTNGNTQITVTNGAEEVEVYSYTVWHTSTMTTNEWVDEYGATNTSIDTLWAPVSPPFNGIDSEWECLTTNLALSGGVGIYEDTNSPGNARVRFYAVANRSDSDGDGLSDGAEIFIHRTDPDDPDADGDGVGDGVEIALGSDPLDMASFPAMTELDEALGLVNVAQLGYLGYLAGVTFSYDSPTNYAQRIHQLRDMLEGLMGSFLDLDVNTGGVLAERPDVATWSLGTVLASTGNSSGQWLGGLASTAQVEEIGAVLGKLSRLVNEGSRQSGHAHQPIALHTGVVQVGSAWNLGTGYPERWPTNQPIQTYLLLDTKVDIPYVGPGTVDDWIDVNGSARFPVTGYIYTNHVADITPVWEPEGPNTLELWDCGDCAGENNYAYLSPFTLVQVLEVPIIKVEIIDADFIPHPPSDALINPETDYFGFEQQSGMDWDLAVMVSPAEAMPLVEVRHVQFVNGKKVRNYRVPPDPPPVVIGEKVSSEPEWILDGINGHDEWTGIGAFYLIIEGDRPSLVQHAGTWEGLSIDLLIENFVQYRIAEGEWRTLARGSWQSAGAAQAQPDGGGGYIVTGEISAGIISDFTPSASLPTAPIYPPVFNDLGWEPY